MDELLRYIKGDIAPYVGGYGDKVLLGSLLDALGDKSFESYKFTLDLVCAEGVVRDLLTKFNVNPQDLRSILESQFSEFMKVVNSVFPEWDDHRRLQLFSDYLHEVEYQSPADFQDWCHGIEQWEKVNS